MKYRILQNLLLFVLIEVFSLASHSVTAQRLNFSEFADSTKVSSKAKPDLNKIPPYRLAIRSALVPGWGQLTNGQWWKIPIIYGGGAAMGYFIAYNNRYYIQFRNAYRIRNDNDPNTLDEFDPLNPDRTNAFSNSGLLVNRESFKRNRDLLIILTGLLYGANVLDAYITGHLQTFDISDDLSLSPHIQLSPTLLSSLASPGTFVAGAQLNLSLYMNFR